MMNPKSLKTLAIGSLTTVLGLAAHPAAAHTTIRDAATEGVTAYNALQIGHTCELESGKKIPVIAQSVVFPTASPTVTQVLVTDATTTPVTTQSTATTLDAEITDSLGLAAKASLVQDRNIFKKQNLTLDGNGNVIGFYATNGNLQTDLRGLVPFRFTPISFKSTSCAKRMLVKVAVADICKKTFPPKAGTANLWIPATTAKFTDANIDGIGSPATLTINRDLTKNPLPEGCPVNANADGTTTPGYDVVVTPSAQDVDDHLPFKGWR
ncbi:hypothetical protein [Methylomagnum ishizawai]|uniref:hypothetical protein n=1 Tax=Methylomagnum ishizawai TaxID=1760988 RepID=UPI001C7EA931|nr:hypothetical protein [Methylomagnum ishizawai]